MLLAAFKGAFLSQRRTAITKTLLAMRLTGILLLATCLHLSAKTRAQQINLSEQNVPLNKVFKKITDQTGYLFVYRDEWMKQTHDISISVRNAGLKDVLDICFKNQPFTYAIIDKMVVLKDTVPPTVITFEDAPKDGVHGRVADSLGAPLAGASVRIKGTSKGTQSDIRGDFVMKNIPAGTVIVVSYTGYVTREFTVNEKNAGYFYMALKRSADELDATVIQAYGTTSRRFNVGSISTVDAATIEKQPVTNVLLALQGQAPGLSVTATSGAPGSQVLVQVRGQNTMLSNPTAFGPAGWKPYDQPLFIIDGVPFAPQNANLNQLTTLANNNGATGGINVFGGISPFGSINPNDIESISILKDADATSIYGTQGSNGVILITTKKGKPGKTLFNLTATSGYNSPERNIKLMNTQQYTQMRKDAFAYDSLTPSSSPFNYQTYAPDLLIFDQNKYTNWEKLVYGKTSNNTDIHGTLSGGTYNNTFLVSGGYTRSTYNFPGDFADQRLTLHTNFHHASPDNRLSVDFGTDVGYDRNNSPGGGSSSILLAPNTPDLQDPKGNLVWSYKSVDLSNAQEQSFYVFLKQPDLVQTNNLNSTLRVAYKIMTGLSISTNLGYNRNTTSERQEEPSTSQNPSYINRQVQFTTNNYTTINVEPQIDYSVNIGKGLFTALAGATYKKNSNNSNVLSGGGYANDAFLGSIQGAASVSAQDASSLYKYDATFARLKYVYDREFILSLTGRRDGSSNFGPGRQFGSFGSVGAGWIFSEESAFRKALPFVSYAKLSGSYGTSGSDGVAPYLYQPFYQPVGFIPPFQGVQPNYPTNFFNPDYSWALKKSLNILLDLGLFHDRVLLNATYYRDREGNQLGGYPLPIQSGFGAVLENLPGTVQDAGWEFSATSNQIKTKTFSWSTNFNITFNRNKLLSFPNLDGSPYVGKYVVGKPTSEIFGYRFKGLNPQTGLFEYYTAKGAVTNTPSYNLISQGGDQGPIGDQEVKYMGGLGNTLSYKQFSLYFFFQFSSQNAPTYMHTVYNEYTPGESQHNEPVEVANYWKKPGDHATFQKLTTGYGSAAYFSSSAFSLSSGAYATDTYARLKTVALSYNLPVDFCKKAHIQNARIFVNAQNVLTITNWKVADPEQFGNYDAVPIQRTVVCGLNFNF